MILDYLAGEGGLALLDMNPGLVIWTFIAFFVVLLILAKFAWGPIAKALDERAERIHQDIDRAEKLKTDAENKLQEYMNRLDGLREEGQQIVAEANEDAKRLRDKIMSEAKVESEALKKRALREVSLARDEALESIHKSIADVASVVAGKIIEKNLNDGDYSKIIQDTLKEVDSLN